MPLVTSCIYLIHKCIVVINLRWDFSFFPTHLTCVQTTLSDRLINFSKMWMWFSLSFAHWSLRTQTELLLDVDRLLFKAAASALSSPNNRMFLGQQGDVVFTLRGGRRPTQGFLSFVWGGSLSDVVVSSAGTPQGTVLAPFLFTPDISAFQCNSETCHLQRFSDDTAVVGCI